MATSRRDFLKKGSLVAVAAAVPAGVARGALRRETVVAPSPESLLDKAAFLSALNTEFRISHNRSNVVVKLAEVTDLDHRRGARSGKEGFSLFFRGAGSVLDQNTYTLEHEKLGKFSLLLVPVHSRKNGRVGHAAVVNRLYP